MSASSYAVAGLQSSCFVNNTFGYDICLDLKGPSGEFERWMRDFGQAVARWESVILGDLPSIESALLPTNITCTGYPAIIDDLYICGVNDDTPGSQ